MKILNVTPYCISNYGAMLQAWALRHVLEEFGHQVVYLNYPRIWPGHFGWKQLLYSRSLASIRAKIAMNKQHEVVKHELGGWIETKPYWSVNSLIEDAPSADCYLVGSDQVFSLDKMLDFNMGCHALLAFGDRDIPRVAYAASFGRPSWSRSEISTAQWAVPYLKRFRAIGLREASGIDILQNWAGVNGHWTPDPTLLLDRTDYKKQFSISFLQSHKPRVFTYMLGFRERPECNQLYHNAVKSVVKYLGGDAEVCQADIPRALSWWLSNLVNADYVITNSFHGICFSILFNRPFLPLGFVGKDAWRNERAQRILAVFGLLDRYVTQSNLHSVQNVLSGDFDWNRINSLRIELAERGRAFLRQSLK